MSLLTEHDNIDILIACIMGEAEAESVIGKIAVACVIRNRVTDHRWPNTYKAVCLQAQQFSCFNPDQFRSEIMRPQYSNIYWRESKFAAWGVMNDYLRDITRGANLYWNPDIIEKPNWDWSKVELLDKIEHHQFAREF